MDASAHSSPARSVVAILIGVPIALASTYLLLFALHATAEALAGRAEGGAPLSAFALRWGLAAALVLAGALALRTRRAVPEAVPAILVATAVGYLMAAVLVSLYETPVAAVAVAVGIAALAAAGLWLLRRPWPALLAVGWGALLALSYGWPV